MKKILPLILTIFVIGLGLVIFNRNMIARFIIVKGVRKVCGLDVKIEKLNIGLPNIRISGLKIYNPADFKDRLLADIPNVYLDLDFAAFFKNKVNIGKLGIEVGQLDIILNDQGRLNVNSLALLLPKSGSGAKPPEINIKELSVKIGKVIYKGYFPAAGQNSFEFNADFDETFHNVTNPSAVAAEILQKILSRIGIANLASFEAPGKVPQAVKQAGEAVKEKLDSAGKSLKGIFSK